nr:Protein F14D12.1, isoform a [Haemonchus contortus]
MKERVDLNSNGLCIESSGRILKNGKWVKRYILCKKPTDVSTPILYVYKSKKDRQSNNSKTSLVLQNYVGFESGFELKKSQHTLALITLEDIVVISFLLPESLVVWETWLRSTCGTSTCFYMQLHHAPQRSEFASVLYKEVRCHLHDSRMAIVYGRPQKLLLYCDIHFARINVDQNNMVTVQPSESSTDECFVFMCARSETFHRMLTKAMREKGLHRYLSKKNSEGDWMPDFVVPKRVEQADTESQFSHTLSGLFNFFNIEQSKQSKRVNLDKEKSKSGFHVGGASGPKVHSNLARANSLAFYHNTKAPATREEPVANYVNIGRHSVSKPILDRERGGSERERIYATSRKASRFEPAVTANYENYQNKESIIQNRLANVLHRKSLPNYINAPQTSHLRKATEEKQFSMRSPSHGYRRKSELALVHAMDKPSTSKGRSVGDLKAARLEESRYENWRKAKKFISSIKPKSQSDLNQRNKMNRLSLVKSSSTGALQFASSAPYYNEAIGGESSDSLTDDFDEPPPSLDLVVCETSTLQKEFEESPPEGLVRPREDIQIKPRAGVSAVLARRLAASITGSFSKYDGERATHHYQGDPPSDSVKAASPPMLEALDGIEAAVYRGQDRLKESDRRASSVSFHKVLPMPMKQPKQKKSSVSINQKSVVHITSPRNSTSYSESTRSSSESLSSDARSRISFRKRTNSPPKVAAPILLPRQPSSHTLLQASTSGESLESERTARTSNSPSLLRRYSRPDTSLHSLQSTASSRQTLNYCDVALPIAANSSSSSTSINSRVEYVTIDPVSTTAAREASSMHLSPFERSRAMSTSMTGVPIIRRRSHGQSSTSDSVSLGQPTRQGFFRKYRKMRRNKKNASMSQLNM